MGIRLDQRRWYISDETNWTRDWVGLSSGDIYQGDEPFGHYVAAWYPNTDRDMVMIVTALEQGGRPVMSVGIRCRRNDLNSLAPVNPEDLPWESDGVMFGPVARVEEIETYARAREALLIAKDVVHLDRSLRKYLCEPELRVQEPAKEDSDGNYFDGSA